MTKTISRSDCHSECEGGRCLYADDPTLTVSQAAAYLGRHPRTVLRLDLERVPLAGTGNEWGYRRSTLNRYLRELESARGAPGVRRALLKKSPAHNILPASARGDASTPHTALATGG